MKLNPASNLKLIVALLASLSTLASGCRLSTNNPEKLEALKAGYEYDENGIVIKPSPSPSATASETGTLQYNTTTSNLNIVGFEIESLSPTSTVLAGTVTFSISPSLPSGLTIGANNGIISGTPTAASASTTYTVSAKDDSGRTASTTISLKVSQVSSIKLGGTHNCAIIEQSLYCWGNNANGALGIGALGYTNYDTPKLVSDLGATVSNVSEGGRLHTCAVKTDGTAWCWGSNGSGQIGNNSATSYYSPVQVQEMPTGITATQIIGANATSCAVMSNGSVYCWGNNTSGRVGNNSSSNTALPPTQVFGLTSGVTQLASAYDTTCALKSDGTVWCWGYGSMGAIGNNTGVSQTSPKQVVGIDGVGLLSGATQISGRYYSFCAVLNTGALACWGQNNVGSLGDNSTTNRNYPVSVVNMTSGVTAVSVGDFHACAIKNSAAYCWGMNSVGQLGDGTRTNSLIPVAVQGATSGVTQIAAGGYINPAASAGSCAVVNSVLKCWGSNAAGRLGNTSLSKMWTSAVTPSGLVSGTIQSISTGGSQTCAAINGSVYCSGTNDYYQMGLNSVTTSAVPTPALISGLVSGFTQVEAGRYTNCALRDDTTVWCWGYGGEGGLGINGTTSSAVPVQAMISSVSKLYSGYKNICAIKADDSLWCWGPNSKGEIGNNTTTMAKIPTQMFASGIKLATSAYQFSCAVKTDDTVWCTGANASGQLGNNSTTNSLIPVQVQGLPATGTVTSIASSYNATCAIKNSVTYCWGYYAAKWAGDLSGGNALVATQVQGIQGTPSKVIRSGSYGACTLMTDNSLWCWGENNGNQLLKSVPSEYEGPTRVPPFSGTISKIDGGASHICALKSDGTLWCWGHNMFGQIGDGTNYLSRAQVVGPFIKP